MNYRKRTTTSETAAGNLLRTASLRWLAVGVLCVGCSGTVGTGKEWTPLDGRDDDGDAGSSGSRRGDSDRDREPSTSSDAGADDRASDDDDESSSDDARGASDEPNVSSDPDDDGNTVQEPEDLPEAELDPGFKGIHRLNNREYDNTVVALLGTQLRPAQSLLNESGHGFDNIASSLGMTVGQYAGYFRAASEVAADVFASSELRERVLTCDPEPDAEACAQQIVEDFGLRAFRRPLSEQERETYVGVYFRATDLGLNHNEATQQVVRAMLSSAEFLYRMEFDEDPSSTEPHDVSSYELASRLSYFLWSAMPDDELLEVARDGSLSESDEFEGQVARLLEDPRAAALVDSFAWQWLGMKGLESHAVLADAYPEWDEDLRQSMLGQARAYLSEFVRGDQDWSDVLTADFHFVDQRLAGYYGVDAPSDGFEVVDLGDDERVGFMGLPGFLTLSSFSHRTSPTLRAKWVLEALMCAPPPPPPADLDVADLDAAELANQAASIDNVQERLELHRTDPACNSCHALLDPLGLALENYDAIGQFRTEYSDGSAIDPRGELPDGTELSGLASLAEVVEGDERFLRCTTEKLLIYALGRGLGTADRVHLQSVVDEWSAGDPTITELVGHVTSSVPFKQRRGGRGGAN